MGALGGATEWYSYRNESYFRVYLVVNALGAFVLTPLIVGVFLALPDLARRLLRRLREDGVVDVRPNPELEAVPELGWFNHRALVLAAAAIAGMYFALELVVEDTADTHLATFRLSRLWLSGRPWCILLLSRCCTWSSFQGGWRDARTSRAHSAAASDRCGGLWIVGTSVQSHAERCGCSRRRCAVHHPVLQGTPVVPARRPGCICWSRSTFACFPRPF
jgi:hypothetical protein